MVAKEISEKWICTGTLPFMQSKGTLMKQATSVAFVLSTRWSLFKGPDAS